MIHHFEREEEAVRVFLALKREKRARGYRPRMAAHFATTALVSKRRRGVLFGKQRTGRARVPPTSSVPRCGKDRTNASGDLSGRLARALDRQLEAKGANNLQNGLIPQF
jgi:hypothetical protein